MFSTKQLFLTNQISLIERKPFIFSKSVSSGTTVYVPFCSYQAVLVDWDDGSPLETLNPNTIISHTYSTTKTAVVTVYALTAYTTRGVYPVFNTTAPFAGTILQWGDAVWTNMFSAFYNHTPTVSDNIIINATDWPNVGNVQDFSYCFYQNRNFIGYSYMDNWNTSSAITFNNMFFDCNFFNSYIGNWNASNVTNMSYMFANASSFNQDISNWNTQSLQTLDSAFINATAFNQPIGKWNTINTINFTNIFWYSNLNQNMSNWRLDSATTISNPFRFSSMSTENYSRTLIGWANIYYNLTQISGALPQYLNKTLLMNGMTYNNTNYGGTPYNNAVSARTYLGNFPFPAGLGWSITGDSQV